MAKEYSISSPEEARSFIDSELNRVSYVVDQLAQTAEQDQNNQHAIAVANDVRDAKFLLARTNDLLEKHKSSEPIAATYDRDQQKIENLLGKLEQVEKQYGIELSFPQSSLEKAVVPGSATQEVLRDTPMTTEQILESVQRKKKDQIDDTPVVEGELVDENEEDWIKQTEVFKQNINQFLQQYREFLRNQDKTLDQVQPLFDLHRELVASLSEIEQFVSDNNLSDPQESKAKFIKMQSDRLKDPGDILRQEEQRLQAKLEAELRDPSISSQKYIQALEGYLTSNQASVTKIEAQLATATLADDEIDAIDQEIISLQQGLKLHVDNLITQVVFLETNPGSLNEVMMAKEIRSQHLQARTEENPTPDNLSPAYIFKERLDFLRARGWELKNKQTFSEVDDLFASLSPNLEQQFDDIVTQGMAGFTDRRDLAQDLAQSLQSIKSKISYLTSQTDQQQSQQLVIISNRYDIKLKALEFEVERRKNATFAFWRTNILTIHPELQAINDKLQELNSDTPPFYKMEAAKELQELVDTVRSFMKNFDFPDQNYQNHIETQYLQQANTLIEQLQGNEEYGYSVDVLIKFITGGGSEAKGSYAGIPEEWKEGDVWKQQKPEQIAAAILSYINIVVLDGAATGDSAFFNVDIMNHQPTGLGEHNDIKSIIGAFMSASDLFKDNDPEKSRKFIELGNKLFHDMGQLQQLFARGKQVRSLEQDADGLIAFYMAKKDNTGQDNKMSIQDWERISKIGYPYNVDAVTGKETISYGERMLWAMQASMFVNDPDIIPEAVLSTDIKPTINPTVTLQNLIDKVRQQQGNELFISLTEQTVLKSLDTSPANAEFRQFLDEISQASNRTIPLTQRVRDLIEDKFAEVQSLTPDQKNEWEEKVKAIGDQPIIIRDVHKKSPISQYPEKVKARDHINVVNHIIEELAGGEVEPSWITYAKRFPQRAEVTEEKDEKGNYYPKNKHGKAEYRHEFALRIKEYARNYIMAEMYGRDAQGKAIDASSNPEKALPGSRWHAFIESRETANNKTYLNNEALREQKAADSINILQHLINKLNAPLGSDLFISPAEQMVLKSLHELANDDSLSRLLEQVAEAENNTIPLDQVTADLIRRKFTEVQALTPDQKTSWKEILNGRIGSRIGAGYIPTYAATNILHYSLFQCRAEGEVMTGQYVLTETNIEEVPVDPTMFQAFMGNMKKLLRRSQEIPTRPQEIQRIIGVFDKDNRPPDPSTLAPNQRLYPVLSAADKPTAVLTISRDFRSSGYANGLLFNPDEAAGGYFLPEIIKDKVYSVMHDQLRAYYYTPVVEEDGRWLEEPVGITLDEAIMTAISQEEFMSIPFSTAIKVSGGYENWYDLLKYGHDRYNQFTKPSKDLANIARADVASGEAMSTVDPTIVVEFLRPLLRSMGNYAMFRPTDYGELGDVSFESVAERDLFYQVEDWYLGEVEDFRANGWDIRNLQWKLLNDPPPQIYGLTIPVFANETVTPAQKLASILKKVVKGSKHLTKNHKWTDIPDSKNPSKTKRWHNRADMSIYIPDPENGEKMTAFEREVVMNMNNSDYQVAAKLMYGYAMIAAFSFSDRAKITLRDRNAIKAALSRESYERLKDFGENAFYKAFVGAVLNPESIKFYTDREVDAMLSTAGVPSGILPLMNDIKQTVSGLT